MSNIILKGTALCKSYNTTDNQLLHACRGVDITMYKGQTVGIVGESGCGKSTLLKLLAGLEPPTSGTIEFTTPQTSHQSIQMVFQDPTTAFAPHMKVRQALAEPLRNYFKLKGDALDNRIEELLSLVHLPVSFADRLCHHMSGGQRQRLGIARAIAPNPQLLICDEATSALDVSIQKEIIQLLANLQKQQNLSVAFVCHDIALVSSISHQVMIMYLGQVVESLPSHLLATQAQHPYAQLLISSMFGISSDRNKPITTLSGEVPSPINLPNGCAFASRCPKAQPECYKTSPTLQQTGTDHYTACHCVANNL